MYDFTDILAALVILIAIGGLIFFPVAILHAHKLRKALEDSRHYARGLEETLAKNRHTVSSMRWLAAELDKEITGAIEWNAQLLQEIEERKALPLRDLSDEQLVEAIRKELTYRVEKLYLNQWVNGPVVLTGDEAVWKIASKVGGAAFRVVDKAKRGKLEFQS